MTASIDLESLRGHTPGEWTKYSDQRPPAKGVYQWRIPSIGTPGIFVVFLDWMRERGAGFERVVSPRFDYWDGYRVHVPAEAQWRVAPDHKPFRNCDYADLHPEGVELIACPYCKAIPRWRGSSASIYGGESYGCDPHKINRWWLECCTWANTPRFDDPRRLAERRNTALAELTARRARDAEVEALVAAAKRANGDHTAPHDCYATGPSTGDDYLDLVSCPGCELAAALLPFAGDKT